MAAVLIADSSEDVAFLLAVALRRHGHAVSVWRRGETPAEPVDVVVIDAALEGSDEVLAEVLATSPEAEVIATGIRTVSARETPCGARHYFRKPFSLADLATAVTLATPTTFLPAAHPSSY